ncbi:MAG TPA: hypothetical protein VIT23_15170, partial [Terrimicrobiaceae bacterium]
MFALLLLNFQRKLTEEGPAKAFDYMFGFERSRLDSYRPTQAETKEFIETLTSAIKLEAKGYLAPDRRLALWQVSLYNDFPGEPYFQGIQPQVFAFQLALRIREPSLIDQKELKICGENSTMIWFAKERPTSFADYAISLMRAGEGHFFSLKVTPKDRSAWSLCSNKISAADFVTMCSLSIHFFGSLKEGSTADEVSDRLSKAGFLKVQNNSLVDALRAKRYQPLEDNLRNAAVAVAAKKLVMIFIQSEAVEFLRSLKIAKAQEVGFGNWKQANPALIRTSGDSLQPGRGFDAEALPPRAELPPRMHWITVSRLSVQESSVTIKLYSWQHSVEGTLPLENF